MVFQALRIHAAFAEGSLQVSLKMQALAARGDFYALEQ
jgi:hypothetical protein